MTRSRLFPSPSQQRTNLSSRIAAVYALLIIVNLAAWGCALFAFLDQPVLLGTAFLAYSLGLRHALDADHIAAIDNATRKLMHEGQRPVMVGFFFALGHSAVVIVASVVAMLAIHVVRDKFSAYRAAGEIIGTSASAFFLFAIGLANILILRGLYRALALARNGTLVRNEDIDRLLQTRGWLMRLFRPMFRLVSKSWHLFPIGLLFALGFDTAS